MKATKDGESLHRVCFMAIQFALTHKTFTVPDLIEHIGCTRSRAVRVFNEMCTVFPIVEVKPKRHSGYVHGCLPALYRLEK